MKLGGFLINKELKEINRITTNPKRPFVCILGGAKVSDKIKLIYNLLDKIDDLIIGGGMAFTFLKVMFNMPIGKSLFDKEGCNEIQKIIDKAEKNNVKIHLPLDFIGSEEFNNTDSKYFNRNTGISKNYMGLDIGNKSIKYFNKIIDKSETILWNGPMGVFEFSNFCNGSKSVVTKIEQISHSKNIVIGGGDTASCYLNFSSNTDYVHVSTGGGATLKLLEGKSLYGIESLSN